MVSSKIDYFLVQWQLLLSRGQHTTIVTNIFALVKFSLC